MNLSKRDERRRFLRRQLKQPDIAAVWPHEMNPVENNSWDNGNRLHYVDVSDRSSGGVLVKASRPFSNGRQLYFSVYDAAGRRWENYQAEPRWCENDPSKNGNYHIGLRIVPIAASMEAILPATEFKTGPFPADYEFFRTVPFLRAIRREAVCPLLNHITYRQVHAGAQFITQGQKGNTCYIVQSGSCRVLVEKQGRMHRVGRIRKRDFVGEIALLTDEPRSAHVIAESDMELWQISKEMLDALIERDPEVASFLTEIISERISSRQLTAERSIGKYLITDIIGRGGYAIVYLGQHVDLNRPVAIKMLKHDMALNPEFSDNFRKEARTIANFNHENIVKVYDIEARYRTLFIVMEYLEGRTLKDTLDEVGSLPFTAAVEIIFNIANGLQYAHEKGIVHQDIKPANVFLTQGGPVKILDFGLCAPCGSEQFFSGTPFYMSPEQVECLPIDARSDIYSLGLTAYEMVTGRKAFQNQDPLQVANLHVEQDIPDPAEIVADIPPLLRDFIRKACARNPASRFQNIPEALDLLEPLAIRLGLSLEGRTFNKRVISTLFLSYREDQQLELNRILEEFSERIKKLGVQLRVAEFKDL
jgi:serine/threonine protein kinase